MSIQSIKQMGGCISQNRPAAELSKYCVEQAHNQTQYVDEVMIRDQHLFRIQGKKLKQLLHRSVVAITFVNKYKKIGVGSGVLISNNAVLTAAHNIYDKDNQCEYQVFKLYLGTDGEAELFHDVQSWRFPEQFMTCPKSEKLPFDYAIMKLKKPFDFGEYLPLSFPCQICLPQSKDKEISLYGFPGSLQNYKSLDQKGVKIKLYQYGLTRKDRIVLIDSARFKIGYGISTLAGQSGSPVTVDDAVIAIHVGGFQSQYNVGRIIDAILVTNIKKWVEQLGAFPFEIQCNNVCKHTNQTVDKFITRELRLTVQGISTIDLAKYRNLLKLDLYNNNIRQINLEVCPLLRQVQLGRNLLKEIEVSSNTNLIGLYVPQNYFVEIDISSNVKLTSIAFNENKISAINLRQNVSLESISLFSNKLDSIDLSFNTNLTRLDVGANNLSSIDLGNNPKLKHIGIWMNNIVTLNLSSQLHLQYLYASTNRLANIDLSTKKMLRGLNLKSNSLENISLFISGNNAEPYIKYFSLQNQASKKCRVNLKCENTELNTAADVVRQWKQKYQSPEHNERDCQYTFFVEI